MSTLSTLLTRFQKPEMMFRPVQIIHHKYPKTLDAVNEYLDEAEKNGMGGFCVNMQFLPERLKIETGDSYRIRSMEGYLGEGTPECEEEWAALARFIDACFDRGMKVWIYDELKYPSGAAGDRVLKGHPEDQVKGLACTSKEVKGGKGAIPGEPGRLLSAKAYPVKNGVLITKDAVDVEVKNGSIFYDLPEGDWRVAAVYVKPVEFYTENLVPYPDLMRADVVDRFINVTHEMYLKHLGEERIKKIVAFFTDEPGLPTHGCSSYFYEKNTTAIEAFTEAIEGEFEGFSDKVIGLFFNTDKGDAAFRRAYRASCADKFAKNYFGRIAAWCEKHGTRMTGHMYGEETLSMQIGLNAELFGLMRYMQMPGVDRLYCTDPRDVTPEKTATSAAHLYGREFTMSENSFHFEFNFWNMPGEATHENRQNSAYYQMQLGLTHVASYLPYPDEKRYLFEENCARASMFITTGAHRAGSLVLIPMKAAHERYMPQDHKYWNVGPCTVAPHQPMDIQTLEKAYGETLLTLSDNRYDYDLIDDIGLSQCKIENAAIRTPYESFGHLIVFDSGEPEKTTGDFIECFLKSGGKVTAVTTDRPGKVFAALRAQYPDTLVFTDSEKILSAMNGRVQPELALCAPETVRVRKSETDDAELWFIHNRADACTVTVHEKGNFTLLSPESSEIKAEIASDGEFALDLKKFEAVMLVKEK